MDQARLKALLDGREPGKPHADLVKFAALYDLLVLEKPFGEVVEKYDVSDNTLRKWRNQFWEGTLNISPDLIDKLRVALVAPPPPDSPFHAAQNFTAFKLKISGIKSNAPHLVLLDQSLQQIADDMERFDRAEDGAESDPPRLDHLIVSMPPRHGKSFTIARHFTAWFLGKFPEKRVILASYAAHLARKHSRAARDILKSPAYAQLFPTIRLSPDVRSAETWDIADHGGGGGGGGMDAVGVGGGITGKGAHLIIVDDPVKGRAEAESVLHRAKLWSWFTDDLYTRREPGAAVIVVMTRWHQDDLIGRLIREQGVEESGGRWRYLRLPAIGEEGDPLNAELHREVGQALWEARFPLKDLLAREETMGAYSFAGLYQQNPVPAAGGLFKQDRFQIISAPPVNITRAVRFWDLALSARTHADYTVGLLMGMTKDLQFVVLDVQRFRANWGDLVPKLAAIIAADDADVIQHVEAAFHHSQAVRDLLAHPLMSGRAIFPAYPQGDKWTRAQPFAAQVTMGNVYVLRRAWMEPFSAELAAFPLGTHDDQVDAAVGAYLALVAEEKQQRKLVGGVVRYA